LTQKIKKEELVIYG